MGWLRTGPIQTHSYRDLRRHLQNAFPWLVIALGIITVALLISFWIYTRDSDQRIRVGNTGGSLTTLIEVADTRMLIGAGPTRSHAADLIGRSTRPWDRFIDLLVLPGWDDFHVVGAIGLLERREVGGIAIAGVAGESPIWTLFERQAQRADVPVRFLDQAHVLQIGEETQMTLTPVLDEQSATRGSWVRLDHRGARIDLVDGPRDVKLSPPPAVMSSSNNHLVIEMRSSLETGNQRAALVVRPKPYYRSEFEQSADRFRVHLGRNERVGISLDGDDVRVPLERIEEKP